MSLTIRKVAGALGAEISGVDLSQDLPDAVIAGIRAALVERTCGTCRHYDPDHGTQDGVRYGFCTNLHAWHAGRSMPPFDGCIAWAARDEDDGA
jgi:taurine dioxygenase